MTAFDVAMHGEGTGVETRVEGGAFRGAAPPYRQHAVVCTVASEVGNSDKLAIAI